MENASKALIIAGAILLAILLISLGLIVFRNASGTINGANLSKEEIQAFNYQFDGYCGTNKSATEVKNLIQVVMANNATDSERQVSIKTSLFGGGEGGDNFSGKEGAIPTKMPTISSSRKYTVEAHQSAGGIYDYIEVK